MNSTIELLVTIVIIGILSAVALPSFLNQASKSKEVAAKTTIGAVNSAQAAFRAENNSFAPDMKSLALGLPTDTANYKFEVIGGQDSATITATAKDAALKGYAGGAVRYGLQGESAVATIVCQDKRSSTNPPTVPAFNTDGDSPETAVICASSQEKL